MPVHRIRQVQAQEIFDSRGHPTVEVDLCTEYSVLRAAAPGRASTGVYVALEIRGGKYSRLIDELVGAVAKPDDLTTPKPMGIVMRDQAGTDKIVVETPDDPKNEGNLRQ